MRRFIRALSSAIAISALAVGAGGGAPAPIAGAQDAPWGKRAQMPLPRSEMSIAQIETRIFALGGYPGQRITSDSVQIYDARTDSWELGPPLPIPLHHTMAAVVDKTLYVIGGEAGNPTAGQSVFQSRVYMLDEKVQTWVERAPMPTARSGGGAAVVNGKIYVAGGRPPRGADFAVYDPAADAWTTLPDIPTQRNHLGVAAIGDRVYVAGGRFGGGVGSEMTDALEIFDPATGTWTYGAPLLSPRAGVSAVAANGCLYLIGGEGNDADPRGVFDLNEMYDPGTNSWTALEPMPLPTHGLTGAAFLDGWIYVPGGATRRGVSGADVTTDIQVYKTSQTCSPAR